ncbi:hypothetical protein NDU88_002548 [Pleurodeles waltl]|uniref:Uncharacterized protein n=1 Tax=Pleurodeles waltl TaxID=8319 RepID=A0AAV7P711_PLEWA|nr:hypothetical protein NDU88_002548 [Pleurodeles waltl]
MVTLLMDIMNSCIIMVIGLSHLTPIVSVTSPGGGCGPGEPEIDEGHRTTASEKQEETLPSRTVRKESLRVQQDEEPEEVRDGNPRKPEDGEALHQQLKTFEEQPGNHGGARHVPGGVWQSQGNRSNVTGEENRPYSTRG